jgi:very-short-patch-repair endonuclease
VTPLESPIEWKFAAAVRDTIDPFFLKQQTQSSTLQEMLTEWDSNHTHLYICAPQVQCCQHRVDFLFIGFCAELKPVLVAVECDGHDFHERSKEQAAKDKSRDRELASMGIQVMRFTGSEIHRDAPKCVREVIDLMERRSDEAMAFCHPSLWAEICGEGEIARGESAIARMTLKNIISQVGS